MTSTEPDVDYGQPKPGPVPDGRFVAAKAVPMPVFAGAAEIIELVRGLYRRPRLGELPRPEQGTRGGRSPRRGLPMLCLIRPAGLAVLSGLADFLNGQGQGRIPHAMITLAPPDPGRVPEQAPGEHDRDSAADEPDVEAVRGILFSLAELLASGSNAGHGRIRFRRFDLANWLLLQRIDERGLQPDQGLLRLLRERSLTQQRLPSSGNSMLSDLGGPEAVPWWIGILLPVLRRVPPLWFAWKASGRLPFFGAEYRWFLRQPFLAPRDPGTFLGFAERLTIGIREREQETQILMLLVNAFLEDLRRAYRRRLWHLKGARRTTYAIALLDGIRRDNGGYALLKLINDVRNATGAFDPLLVISGSEKLPPEALDPDSGRAMSQIWAASRARSGYMAWCNRLAAASRARISTAWYLPVRVPEAYSPPEPAGAHEHPDPPYTIEKQALEATRVAFADPAPWWARRGVLLPALLALLALLTASGYAAWLPAQKEAQWREAQWRAQHCGQPSSMPDSQWLDSANGECVGISDGQFPFNENKEVATVMQTIADQNQQVIARADQTKRRYVTVVYFNSLGPTSAPEGEVAQRQALAGVAALQKRQLSHDNAVLVRVLVANGGSQMARGEHVAGYVARMAREDTSIIGVVGLGQSRQPTIDTIKKLTQAGLPMVAAALTADHMAESSPMYYQVSPQNRREAAVAAAYARNILLPDGNLVNEVLIVQSNDATDTYSTNLADDVQVAFSANGFAVVRRHHFQPSSPPEPKNELVQNAPAARVVGQEICAFRGVVFYAGRTADFDGLLEGFKQRCGRAPAIIAGDDVSRYVAQPEKRILYPSIEFDYLALAVGKLSCDGTDELYTTIKTLFPGDCGPNGRDPSLNGHAALAYDATFTMVTAAQSLLDQKIQMITPGAVWHAISRISGEQSLEGHTGAIDFGADSHVPVGKAIAILRITEGKPKVHAFCGQHLLHKPDVWCP